MKIVIITQEDSFFIPHNIEKIISLEGINVVLIVNLSTEGALVNKKTYFTKGYGAIQSMKMGMYLFTAKLFNFFDHMSYWKLLKKKRCIRAVADYHGIPYYNIKNPNNDKFLDHLRCLSPNLILSFSSPCVFYPPLLSIPTFGCINLHCSYLPNYAGLLPSFWVLYNKESKTGVTVHYMDDKIDNGDIIAQSEITIDPKMSMFDLIRQTKKEGGDLVCQVMESLQKETIETKENLSSQGTYYSWPTIGQMKEFRRQGGRFV